MDWNDSPLQDKNESFRALRSTQGSLNELEIKMQRSIGSILCPGTRRGPINGPEFMYGTRPVRCATPHSHIMAQSEEVGLDEVSQCLFLALLW